ncbi:MAG: hypothetical protein ACLGPL_01375 [Acidobacteriota bacterium]
MVEGNIRPERNSARSVALSDTAHQSVTCPNTAFKTVHKKVVEVGLSEYGIRFGEKKITIVVVLGRKTEAQNQKTSNRINRRGNRKLRRDPQISDPEIGIAVSWYAQLPRYLGVI